MRKIILVASMFLILLGGHLFAERKGWAIGGAFTFSWAGSNPYGTGAALLLKFPVLPVMFGVNATLVEPISIGVTADWWLFQTHLIGPVDLYIGPGLFLWVSTAQNASPLFGMRIPVGFQIFIAPVFEIFLEPALAIEFIPRLPQFSLQAALGFRFWFNS